MDIFHTLLRIGPRWFLLALMGVLCFPALSPAKEKIDRIVLDNGLVLLVAERHTLPTVHVSMAIQAGAVLDPAEKSGLANLTASLLEEGTKTRTSKQIAEAIDFIGGSLSAAGGVDYASAALTVLKKDIHTGFDLLSDILLHPIFPQEELDRVRREVLGSIISQKTDPGVVASKTFQEMVFKGHPYSQPVEGKEETLPEIRREDIQKFYETYFRPNRTIMVIVGDVNRDEAIRIVKQYFGKWEKKEAPKVLLPSLSNPSGKEVKLIQRDITQANVFLGHLGVARENPDFYKIWVMNYILGGGGFGSRLTTEVRENRGLAYSVYSYFDARKLPGTFRVGLQTKNPSANEAIALVKKEIQRILQEEVTAEELADAKAYLTGSFPLKLDTNSKMANFLTQVEIYNLGLDYIEEYPKKIQAVTRKDVQAAAQKYLDPEHYILVVVADQENAKIQEP
ncbi:MAG: insulinase family protein [Nitrospirae bacterium]|nr:insulinase family protein [Nitrospirota bacterium]